MTLLVDANVLIDLWHTGGLRVLPDLASTEVLDVVLAECDDPRQPGLPEQVRQVGVHVLRTETDWLIGAMGLRTAALSIPDSLNLFYAQRYGRVLLSNDGPLRSRCRELQIPVHGVLWVVQQAHERMLVEETELCQWLSVLSAPERRLPAAEILRLKQAIGCL